MAATTPIYFTIGTGFDGPSLLTTRATPVPYTDAMLHAGAEYTPPLATFTAHSAFEYGCGPPNTQFLISRELHLTRQLDRRSITKYQAEEDTMIMEMNGGMIPDTLTGTWHYMDSQVWNRLQFHNQWHSIIKDYLHIATAGKEYYQSRVLGGHTKALNSNSIFGSRGNRNDIQTIVEFCCFASSSAGIEKLFCWAVSAIAFRAWLIINHRMYIYSPSPGEYSGDMPEEISYINPNRDFKLHLSFDGACKRFIYFHERDMYKEAATSSASDFIARCIMTVYSDNRAAMIKAGIQETHASGWCESYLRKQAIMWITITRYRHMPIKSLIETHNRIFSNSKGQRVSTLRTTFAAWFSQRTGGIRVRKYLYPSALASRATDMVIPYFITHRNFRPFEPIFKETYAKFDETTTIPERKIAVCHLAMALEMIINPRDKDRITKAASNLCTYFEGGGKFITTARLDTSEPAPPLPRLVQFSHEEYYFGDSKSEAKTANGAWPTDEELIIGADVEPLPATTIITTKTKIRRKAIKDKSQFKSEIEALVQNESNPTRDRYLFTPIQAEHQPSRLFLAAPRQAIYHSLTDGNIAPDFHELGPQYYTYTYSIYCLRTGMDMLELRTTDIPTERLRFPVLADGIRPPIGASHPIKFFGVWIYTRIDGKRMPVTHIEHITLCHMCAIDPRVFPDMGDRDIIYNAWCALSCILVYEVDVICTLLKLYREIYDLSLDSSHVNILRDLAAGRKLYHERMEHTFLSADYDAPIIRGAMMDCISKWDDEGRDYSRVPRLDTSAQCMGLITDVRHFYSDMLSIVVLYDDNECKIKVEDVEAKREVGHIRGLIISGCVLEAHEINTPAILRHPNLHIMTSDRKCHTWLQYIKSSIAYAREKIWQPALWFWYNRTRVPDILCAMEPGTPPVQWNSIYQPVSLVDGIVGDLLKPLETAISEKSAEILECIRDQSTFNARTIVGMNAMMHYLTNARSHPNLLAVTRDALERHATGQTVAHNNGSSKIGETPIWQTCKSNIETALTRPPFMLTHSLLLTCALVLMNDYTAASVAIASKAKPPDVIVRINSIITSLIMEGNTTTSQLVKQGIKNTMKSIIPGAIYEWPTNIIFSMMSDSLSKAIIPLPAMPPPASRPITPRPGPITDTKPVLATVAIAAPFAPAVVIEAKTAEPAFIVNALTIPIDKTRVRPRPYSFEEVNGLANSDDDDDTMPRLVKRARIDI